MTGAGTFVLGHGSTLLIFRNGSAFWLLSGRSFVLLSFLKQSVVHPVHLTEAAFKKIANG